MSLEAACARLYFQKEPGVQIMLQLWSDTYALAQRAMVIIFSNKN